MRGSAAGGSAVDMLQDLLNRYSAARTELSQSASLKRTRVNASDKKSSPTQLFVKRATLEEKPTFLQRWKLKSHLERHFHRTTWAFPEGVSFLLWMSGLKPYLNQKTMKEEMMAVVKELDEMMAEVDPDAQGVIDYKKFVEVIFAPVQV